MNSLHVDDLSIGELTNEKYDLAIFSCGYEERCIEVPSKINNDNVSKVLVISFDQHLSDDMRQSNSDFYEAEWPHSELLNITQCNVSGVYSTMRSIIENIDKKIVKVLIDYTSMSRSWYAAILNYLIKFSEKEVVIDLTYANGIYEDESLNVELGELKVIPGCEGISLTKSQNAAIFTLGFDKYGPLRLYNILNPNRCYGVMASPAASYQYEDLCLEKNKEFILHHLDGEKNLVKLPINSISLCYEHMSQMIMPLQNDFNVSIIPFGPKPHILTSILCSFNFPNVTCMYSEYIRKTTTKVQASGEIVISRVYSRYNKLFTG
jgi:hypothetical protein